MALGGALPGALAARRAGADDDDLEPSDDEHPFQPGTLSDWLQQLQINPVQPRFLGKSSGVRLVHSAMSLKEELSGEGKNDTIRKLISRRPEFWNMAAWEAGDIDRFAEAQGRVEYSFPDADLLPKLIDQYFSEMNFILPLLHRPTFEADVAARRHERDKTFAPVVLLVCAIGARHVDDVRVRLPEDDSGGSAGWKYFNQVQAARKSLWAPPRLEDIQLFALTSMFLTGSSAPQACWTVVGVGVRYAQDIGAHRRRMYQSTPSAHDELWKRAFWVLATLDRQLSCSLGRPPAIQDEDFDVDMPVECDDECWTAEDPAQAFVQPPGKPSHMSFFICILKLNQILGFAMRTIYSINKSKVLLGFVGHQWEQNIVAELDSALNKWIDSVPDHLRWDPNREDEVFFAQSAVLYSAYYLVQIIVHRPFIPSPGKQSPLAYPSLAICTNAARSCSHVLDIHQRRAGKPLPYHVANAFTAGIVLLLNIWGGRRSGLAYDCVKEMNDVYKCMNILKKCEGSWHAAGRFWDILCELASVGDLPLPQPSPGPGLKRERDSDESASPVSSGSPSQIPAAQRTIAGSRRAGRAASGAPSGVTGAGAGSQQASQPSSRESSFSLSAAPLPVRSDELGRIPLHPAYARAARAQGAPDGAGVPQSQWFAAPGQQGVPQMRAAQVDPALMALGAAGVPLPHGSQPRMGENAWQADLAYEQMMGNVFGSPQGGAALGVGGMNGFGHHGLQPSLEAPMVNDTMAMWSNAPSNFELDDWGSYLTGITGVTPGHEPHPDFGALP